MSYFLKDIVMLRRVHLQFCFLTLLPMLASSAQLGSFDHFRCLVSGHWDNVQQAEADATLDKDEQNRHPRRAMTYIPVRNPNLDGQLFAILNYTELGFDGPLQRVSLHRFRWLASERSVVHEFFFLKDTERWGKLGEDLRPLTRLRESDARVNENCVMYWHWQGDHFEGATRTGRCITSSFTAEPILVEGHGELWPAKLVRHDQNFTLDGESIAIPGGASPEIFDKVTEAGLQHVARTARIAAVSVTLDCGP